MRRLFAFLVWLFSFYTWKNFFLYWLGSDASDLTNGEMVEHILSQDGRPQSKLARFLSSLPKDKCQCSHVTFEDDLWYDLKVTITFGDLQITIVHSINKEPGFGEFLELVASSNIEFNNKVYISLLGGDLYKHVEAFGDALRKSRKKFKEVDLFYFDGSPISFTKCVSSVLLGNDAIQILGLDLKFVNKEIGKEFVVEFATFMAMPHNLKILKSFTMEALELDGEGMEQLLKPFQGPSSTLENLEFSNLTLDAQLEHISGMLASSTSLKTLDISKRSKKSFARGYNSIAIALGSNQSLKTLSCKISSSVELKVLLEPLMPKNNGLQCNTTLSKLELHDSIGGKEGIQTLVDMFCTNTSLLEFSLPHVKDLSLQDAQGVENVLAILEALKTNKSLKKIEFRWCTAVGGYKVLGAMMDLLLENHIIEDIDLVGTGLKQSGDADYVTSALSKRKKMKLSSVIQSMAFSNPTSGRVFLCGEPYAGKLC